MVGCALFYPSNPLALINSVAFDEILGEQKNIFRALAKRRDMDWKDVQAVEQIQTKLPGTNCRWQIAVCSCNHTHIHWNALCASNAFELAFLKHPQQGDLRFGRHFADLVEKNRPVVRDFEAPSIPLIGTGEGAFLVSEKLSRHQRRWRGSAIHPSENRPGSARPLVNRASDQLLSGATLAGDQNSGIARSNSHHLRGHAADRLGRTDDLLEHGRRQNLVAKVERFLVQLFVDSRPRPARNICEMGRYAIRHGARTQGSKSI